MKKFTSILLIMMTIFYLSSCSSSQPEGESKANESESGNGLHQVHQTMVEAVQNQDFDYVDSASTDNITTFLWRSMKGVPGFHNFEKVTSEEIRGDIALLQEEKENGTTVFRYKKVNGKWLLDYVIKNVSFNSNTPDGGPSSIDLLKHFPPEDGSFGKAGKPWDEIEEKVLYLDSNVLEDKETNWSVKAVTDESYLYVKFISKLPLYAHNRPLEKIERVETDMFVNYNGVDFSTSFIEIGIPGMPVIVLQESQSDSETTEKLLKLNPSVMHMRTSAGEFMNYTVSLTKDVTSTSFLPEENYVEVSEYEITAELPLEYLKFEDVKFLKLRPLISMFNKDKPEVKDILKWEYEVSYYPDMKKAG